MKRDLIPVLVVAVIALLVVAAKAHADDGWTTFTPPVPAADSAPEPVPTPVGIKGSAPNLGQGSGQAKDGLPGPKGDKGDQGIPGPQGIPGVNADLCANLPGIQTEPGWKVWPQRYWSFKPKRERRVLTLNHKSQLVCVTLAWVKKHGVRLAR